MEIKTQSRTEELTPQAWKHVGIYDDGARFKLAGRCHSMPWYPADLWALGIDPNRRTSGIKKLADAIELGGQIESAMASRVVGGLSNPNQRSGMVSAVASMQTTETPPEMESAPVGPVAQAETPATKPEQALNCSRDDLAKRMEGKKVPDPAKASLPPAFVAPPKDPKQADLFA